MQVLTFLLGLGLYSVRASLYQLPQFDTVHIGPLIGDQATVLIVPRLDQTFSLNATQSGVAYSVSDGTLQLNQVSSLPNLLDDLLHVDDEDDTVQTGTIVVEMGGPLLGVLSDTSNDVVVGDRFSSPGFTATLTSSGKLIVLGISTPSTTVWNTGGGTMYVQGDLGLVRVTASDDGGTYLGSSAHYPGSIASVDVHLSGSSSLVVATSSNATNITGLSLDSSQVLYNQGTCTVTCIACEDPCKLARIRVPTLPQYWALSDGAAAAEAAAASPPPPPPSPPPPVPIRDAKVWAQEVTNLITPLAIVPAPAPSEPASAAAPNIFPAWAVPDIASTSATTPAQQLFPATDVPDIASGAAAAAPVPEPAPAPAPLAAAAAAANIFGAAPDLAALESGARFGSGGAAPDQAIANIGSPAPAPRLASAMVHSSSGAAAGASVTTKVASLGAGNHIFAGADVLTQEAAGK